MAQDVSHLRENLTLGQRTKVFDKTAAKVTSQYFDPKFNGTSWPELAREARARIVSIEDPEVFESEMHELVRKLGTSHTGFFHQSARHVPGRLAIGVSFRRAETESGSVWIAQDVHEGGPGYAAGVRPFDTLMTVNGKVVSPPDAPMFSMGTEVSLQLRREDQDVTLMVSIPAPRSRKQPYSEITPVVSKQLPDRVGYLKVSMLPGLLGLDVARSIDRALAGFSECERLVLDLRGHVGGGLGVLRLMSHLTPGKLPIGYTVTRKLAEKRFDKSNLHRLDRLPTNLPNSLAIASMAIQFTGRDPSVLLVSEGLGPKRWHGRVAILVNENTISAGEMVAAFAAENSLATIVGTETAGRLIPGSSIKIEQGYVLVIPRAEYRTWQGQRFEGAGVRPDVEIPWHYQALASGEDNQLERALQTFRALSL